MRAEPPGLLGRLLFPTVIVQMLLTILSLIVLLLTFASFAPQIHHVWRRKDAKGISSAYLLFNLICATEHVLVGFFYMVHMREWPGFWTHRPINVLDWVNIIQLTGVWTLFNVLFFLSLYLKTISRLRKALIIASYVFFLISVVPLILKPTTDACHPGKPNCLEYYGDPILLFWGYRHFVSVPIVATLFILGLYKQARSSSLNLSLAGLTLQAVIFMFSAASWVFRLPFPWKALLEQPYGHVPMYLVIPAWFHMIGFVAIDDAIFALGQGVLAVLLWLALRRERRLADSDPERDPLLGS